MLLTVPKQVKLEAFGFAAALLEGLPLVGFIFKVSNQIGAAMWAHGESDYNVFNLAWQTARMLIKSNADLEKRQHHIAVLKAQEKYTIGAA